MEKKRVILSPYLEDAGILMKDVDKYLEKGDLIQASEKTWGAAAKIVKAHAALVGEDLKSHSSLNRYVDRLSKKEEKIDRLWSHAQSLHQNFYENWLTEVQVKRRIKEVKYFFEIIKKDIV